MNNSDLLFWEEQFHQHLYEKSIDDKSHDINHFKRVWKLCLKFSKDSNASLLTLLAGSYFHDLVNHPKNSVKRSLSSKESALEAEKILTSLSFPEELIENVKHCIESHSFSAGIRPQTLEAEILQDADRMESLGAIGLARTFYVAGRMGSSLFHEDDPFALSRDLDDKSFAIDHFKVKLYRISETMNTRGGRIEARKRVMILERFMEDLKGELGF